MTNRVIFRNDKNIIHLLNAPERVVALVRGRIAAMDPWTWHNSSLSHHDVVKWVAEAGLPAPVENYDTSARRFGYCGHLVWRDSEA